MTRPAPKNISVTPVFQAAWSQFFPFHGEQRKGCQFGSERALIGDGKNCWLSLSPVPGPGSGLWWAGARHSEPGHRPATARLPGRTRSPAPSAAPLLPGRFLMRPVGLRKPPKTGWSQWVFSHWNAQVFSRLKTGTLRSRKIATPMWTLHTAFDGGETPGDVSDLEPQQPPIRCWSEVT